jgi:hypothetical protein
MSVLFLLLFLTCVPSTISAADVVVSDRMHHLRSQGEREWGEFPEQADGAELALAFEAMPNQGEHTLRLRHRDLKQVWRVLVNGKEIARLPQDEADMVTYWPVPAGLLAAGTNHLRIHSSATTGDDVLIGRVMLIGQPVEQVLSQATIDVAVREEPGGRATPSRITIADELGSLIATGNVSGPQHAVRPGVVYSRTGVVRLKLPAGRYVIYAGRGFEYSVGRSEVHLVEGAHVSRRLSIRREVDTRGWVAMDPHVHTGTFARHGDAAIHERMLTIAAEGIELPVSTEHNTLVDFDSHARSAGVRQHFTPVLGSEVTTPGLGHFNVFPMGGDRKVIDERAEDWARLREAIEGGATQPVVVLNHGLDIHGGFRPLGAARHVAIAGEDLAGWSLPANAMEIVNSGAVMSDSLALPRGWMGLLNRGVILTAVGSSDSHDVARYIVGQGRTYVRSDDGEPGGIDVRQAADSVRRGRTMVSYGLVAELEVAGRGPGELLGPGNELDVRVRVKGPSWTRAQHVALYVNGNRVREETVADGTKAGVKWEGTWRLPRPLHDVHLVAIATGPGLTVPFWPTAKPYQPTSIEFMPYVLGMSGAVFVDADGTGRFESALAYARDAVAAARDGRELVLRLDSYDAAVAVQAASLIRVQDPAGFEVRIRSMIQGAPAHVAHGFMTYLEGWQESQAQRVHQTRE